MLLLLLLLLLLTVLLQLLLLLILLLLLLIVLSDPTVTAPTATADRIVATVTAAHTITAAADRTQ